MEENHDNDGRMVVVEQGAANSFSVLYTGPRSNAVSWAAKENRPDVLMRLIEGGQSIRGSDGWGWTALHHAAFLGHTECVRVLLNEDTCEIDGKAFDGTTPLMAACANIPASKPCIKVLCQYKADPKVTHDRGVTALHIAIDRRPGARFNWKKNPHKLSVKKLQ